MKIKALDTYFLSAPLPQPAVAFCCAGLLWSELAGWLPFGVK